MNHILARKHFLIVVLSSNAADAQALDFTPSRFAY